MLRKWVHPEYYHADMTPAAKKHMESHIGESDMFSERNLGAALLILSKITASNSFASLLSVDQTFRLLRSSGIPKRQDRCSMLLSQAILASIGTF